MKLYIGFPPANILGLLTQIQQKAEVENLHEMRASRLEAEKATLVAKLVNLSLKQLRTTFPFAPTGDTAPYWVMYTWHTYVKREDGSEANWDATCHLEYERRTRLILTSWFIKSVDDLKIAVSRLTRQSTGNGDCVPPAARLSAIPGKKGGR